MAEFALWIATILRSQGRARQLDLSFILWMSWMDLRGKMLQQQLAVSRGENCQVPLLSLFHRWISGFLGFPHEDFLGEECVSCAADRYPHENCPHWLDFPLQELDF